MKIKVNKGKVILLLLISVQFSLAQVKPRVLISTDIGGTDPDDFQSMIHLFMYSDKIQLEGLVSSPFGKGSVKDIHHIINVYEKDFLQLKAHYKNIMSPEILRTITKQGTKPLAPYKGYTEATEGSKWIISCAEKKNKQPLWILVWGGLEDVAQALHDAPHISSKVGVYWIGGPNKKWSTNAYNYIATNFPDLFFIENNATYRGWFMEDGTAPESMSTDSFYKNYVKGHGHLAVDFEQYYEGNIKMGDTPSLTYMFSKWGGKFQKLDRSSKIIFNRNTSIKDTIPAYSIMEWHFKGPLLNLDPDSSCFTLEIQNQIWPGYYIGEGSYAVRYSSKKPEQSSYIIHSSIPELNGQHGAYTSNTPWPGKIGKDDIKLGKNWYSDILDPKYFLLDQQGVRLISKYRKDFLGDWAKRWTVLN